MNFNCMILVGEQIDSLRDSTKRMNRQNNGVAPHAKGESSPSPSYSENSDLIGSIKKNDHSSTKINCSKNKQLKHTKQQQQSYSSNDSDVYVIKNEYEAAEITTSSKNIEQTHEMAGYVVSSSTSKAASRNRHDGNCSDCVDCPSVHSNRSCCSAYKIEYKWNKTTNHNDDINVTLSSPITSSSSTTSNSSSSSSSVKQDDSSAENCLSLPTSPASLTTPVAEAFPALKHKEPSNSVPTSPESGTQDIVLRRNQQPNSIIRKCDVSGFRTSRSEDHLQHTQRDIMGAIVPIDVDEDVNSSLNTLLDTRDDSEGTQVRTGLKKFLNEKIKKIVRVC